jgi:hypothetical protein
VTRRRGGQKPTLQMPRTAPATPPPCSAGASTANRPPLPAGPALVYVAPDGTTTPVDETPVTSPRDRALCRALLGRATTVLDDAEAEQKNPVGFTA